MICAQEVSSLHARPANPCRFHNEDLPSVSWSDPSLAPARLFDNSSAQNQSRLGRGWHLTCLNVAVGRFRRRANGSRTFSSVPVFSFRWVTKTRVSESNIKPFG